MSVIQIRVDDQQIALTNMPVIASGGIEENQIEFDFSSDWAGFACVACFYRENTSYTSLISAAGVASVPHEVTATDGKMWLGVMGVKDGVTKTSELVFYKILEGAITEDFDPGEPTPDIYNQILDYVSQVVGRDQKIIALENKVASNTTNITTNAENIATQTERIDNMIGSQQNESVTTLWTGTLDTKNQSVTLSESIANFDFIDIYGGDVDDFYIRKPVSNTVNFEIQIQNMSDDASSQFLRWWESKLTISGTTATITKCIKCYWDDFSQVPVVSQATDGALVTRINGVKIGHVEDDEIVDARVGYNGKTYSNLGDSIRGQCESIVNDLYISGSLLNLQLNTGKYYNGSSGSNYTLVDNANSIYTDLIDVSDKIGSVITVSMSGKNMAGSRVTGFCDINGLIVNCWNESASVWALNPTTNRYEAKFTVTAERFFFSYSSLYDVRFAISDFGQLEHKMNKLERRINVSPNAIEIDLSNISITYDKAFVITNAQITEDTRYGSCIYEKINLSEYIGYSVMIVSDYETSNSSGVTMADVNGTQVAGVGVYVGDILAHGGYHVMAITEETPYLYLSKTTYDTSMRVFVLVGIEQFYNGVKMNPGFVAGDGRVLDYPMNEGRSYSDLIPCPGGTIVKYAGETNHSNISVITFYDKDKVIIETTSNVGAMNNWYYKKSPYNTAFIRLSIRTRYLYGVSFSLFGSNAQSSSGNVDGESLCYVSTSGSDDNSGLTRSDPLRTIGKAITNGFKKILVREGTYNETVSISEKHNIHIMLDPHYSTHVAGTDEDNPKIVIDCNNSLTKGFDIRNCEDCTFENIEVKNATQWGFLIDECVNLRFKDCVAHDIATQDASIGRGGFVMIDTNADFDNCVCYNIGTTSSSPQATYHIDGFNIHGTGTTNFINCSAWNCMDDGISHHDACCGYIDGGEWRNCGKGGIASPTHGAKINISNVYCHHSYAGIYADNDSAVTDRGNIIFSNCVCKNNRYDLIVGDYYKVIAINCVYDTISGENNVTRYGITS